MSKNSKFNPSASLRARMQNYSSKLKISLNILYFALLVIIFNFALLTFNLSPAGALTMSNSDYILQMGNLNTAAGKPTGSGYKLGVTVGQIAPGLYSGASYKVRAGFQYISSIIRFKFSITNTTIDFGTLSASNPVTRTSNLTVSNGSANGYSVTAFENHQLLVNASGAIIPDTTCDTGTCTESTSAAWSSNQTYGFGFRCDNVSGTDCASGFTTSTFYKQFADNSKSETPQSVMESSSAGKNREVQITYKVNISNTQAAGLYTNLITYIATPTF